MNRKHGNETECAWLSCEKIRPGMFSNEMHVTIKRVDGSISSYFVPVNTVRSARVRVERFKGTNFVRIPTSEPLFPVEVREQDIVAA